MIFHNLKNVSLVDQIFGNLGIQRQTEKQKERGQTKQIEKEVWFDLHIRYGGENIANGLPTFIKN